MEGDKKQSRKVKYIVPGIAEQQSKANKRERVSSHGCRRFKTKMYCFNEQAKPWRE